MGNVIRFKNNQLSCYPFNQAVSYTDVIALIQTSDGNIWFGTRGDGLYKIINEKITRTEIPDSLLFGGINVLFEDKDGVLWIGTDNLGLYRYPALEGIQCIPPLSSHLASFPATHCAHCPRARCLCWQ